MWDVSGLQDWANPGIDAFAARGVSFVLIRVHPWLALLAGLNREALLAGLCWRLNLGGGFRIVGP
jgi:hypothetical protein